ncbi:UNVERIFIED_CONTAM: hypothetical protein RMT77_015485 [Armadillidium vulgare]
MLLCKIVLAIFLLLAMTNIHSECMPKWRRHHPGERRIGVTYWRFSQYGRKGFQKRPRNNHYHHLKFIRRK